MTEMTYTTVDRVLSKFHRDLRGAEINESDAIEWIGEALGFLQVYQVQEEAVAFLEVKNYETIVPTYFNMVIQVAKKKNWVKNDPCVTPELVGNYRKSCSCNTTLEPSPKESECSDNPIYTDCQGNIIGPYERVYYRPYFDLQWEYNLWRDSEFFHKDFIPVRLSEHTFFNSIVCKEHNEDLYRHHPFQDEYTIVGTVQKKLRFSFEEGLIALSYIRTAVDKETGYPLIPDCEEYMAAITYYIKWKIAEWYQWNSREGFQGPLVSDLERKWLKYARQAKNKAKMPKSLDEMQNMMEQTYALPNLYKYKNFFGNQNGYENRRYVWLR